MYDGFLARAKVNFIGTRIGGQVACAGGRFEAATGIALDADAAEIGADVYLRDGFLARGQVDFRRVRIGGDLQLHRGTFEAAEKGDGVALKLQSAKVGAALMVNHPDAPDGTTCCTLTGHLDLANARCAVLDDGDIRARDGGASWLSERSELILDGFTYGRLGSRSPTSWAARKAWLDRQPDGDRDGMGDGDAFKPQPYEQLAKVLREMGHAAEAREVGMAKERRHHRAVWRRTPERGRIQRYISRFWWCVRWLLFKLTGYGYRAWRPLVWLGLPVLALSLAATGTAYRLGYMTPAQPHAALAEITAELGDGPQGVDACLSADVTEAVPPFHAGAYVIDAFVPLVDIDQESSWKPARIARCDGDVEKLRALDRLNPGAFTVPDTMGPWEHFISWMARRGGLHWLQWILMISGFAISALIAASLSGLIRRD